MDGNRSPGWFVYLLPFLLAVAFNPAPQRHALTESLEAARLVNTDARHRAGYWLDAARYEPWQAGWWAQAGLALLEAGDAPGSALAFETAMQAGTLTSAEQIAAGKAFLAVGENEKAEAAWMELLSRPHPPVEVYPQLEALQVKTGALDAAENTLHAWLGTYPQDAQALFELGLLLAAVRPEDADDWLEAACNMDGALESQCEIIITGLVVGLLNDDPAYQRISIGRTLGRMERWDLAQVAFQGAADFSPELAEAWAFLGEAKQHNGADGLDDLEKAAFLDPQSTVVKGLQALYWSRQGHPEIALVYIHAVAAGEPDQPLWQMELGDFLAQIGDPVAAMRHYQRAVDMDPGWTLAWEALARFSLSSGYDVRTVGLPAARQAFLLSPSRADLLSLQGQAFLAINDLTTAERFFTLALQRDSSLADAHLGLGQVYLAQGRNAEAILHLAQASSLAGETQPGVKAMADKILGR